MIATLVLSASAAAAPRSGSSAIPTNGGGPGVRTAEASYDPDAGSVSLALTFSTPPSTLESTGLVFEANCDVANGAPQIRPILVEFRSSGQEANGSLVVSYTANARVTQPGEDPALVTDRAYAPVTFNGSAAPIAPWSYGGMVVRTTLQRSVFAGREYRCVRVLQGYADSPFAYSFYFAGHEPLELTRATAIAAFRDRLADEYGRLFTSARRKYVECPARYVTTNEQTAVRSAFCRAQFGSGRSWRYSAGRLTVPRGEETANVRLQGKARWTRRWRTCRTSLAGTLRSRDFGCDQSMARDIATAVRHHRKVRVTRIRGSYSRGFDRIFRYRCKRAAGAYTCKNALGDAFRYRP
jgi:hypothetical protein